MIVYSDRKHEADPSELLAFCNRSRPAGALTALIELGEIESGVADALCPEADGPHPMLEAIRRAITAVARVCWTGTGDIPRLELAGLPPRINVSVPEGYAWYALDPRAYGRAAVRYYQAERPTSVVVIGIRSIGTSLSAAVAAALEHAGCPVRSFTVRPRGHPFDRQLRLSAEFATELRSRRDAAFLVVDEGPGLSGSSFASVARALVEIGIPAERTIFLPAWDPDPTRLLSESARAAWTRHARWFEPAAPLPGRDLSGGLWREVLCPAPPWPAVHPQHERRKYLETGRLWKFAGFGKYGQRCYDRALTLWRAGFIPRPLELADGYLASEFLPGRPFSRRRISRSLVERAQRYLEFVAAEFPSRRPLPLDEIENMVRVNVTESLGHVCADRALELIQKMRPAAASGSPVELDGRMLPHEWIETSNGIFKTDALDHHDDHFFPGPQDILWDRAATSVEFGLAAQSSDNMTYYHLAYLSYRIGYCTMSASTLCSTPDGLRFERLAGRYRLLLGRALSAKPTALSEHQWF
jgi:hypothetical protein